MTLVKRYILGRLTGTVRRAISWRPRIAQHRLHRPAANTEPPRRSPVSQPFVNSRQANPRIECHAAHPLPLATTDEGP